MPADQETIRYTGVYGEDADGRGYLMREVLGGGSGGRSYADGEDTIHVVPDSRNLPTEFTEARFPFRVEALSLAVDSGGAGLHRGGLGYEKQIRMLRDAHFMSIADRSILSCWGVNGGRAGRPFQVTIDPGGPHEREVDALADAEPVRAGEVIRIRTTGGGGWGDPLDRDPGAGRAATCAGARCRRRPRWPTTASCSPARSTATTSAYDEAATAARAGRRGPAATSAFFDRGPGYARLCRRRDRTPTWTCGHEPVRRRPAPPAPLCRPGPRGARGRRRPLRLACSWAPTARCGARSGTGPARATSAASRARPRPVVGVTDPEERATSNGLRPPASTARCARPRTPGSAARPTGVRRLRRTAGAVAGGLGTGGGTGAGAGPCARWLPGSRSTGRLRSSRTRCARCTTERPRAAEPARTNEMPGPPAPGIRPSVCARSGA